MSLEYFGVVDQLFGDHSQLARIRVLARVVEDGTRQDLDFAPADLGNTRRVFLPGGADQIGLREGIAVRFDARENQRPPRPGKDDDLYVATDVTRDTSSFLVVSERRTDGATHLRHSASIPEDSTLYIRHHSFLRGPWRVGEEGRLLPLRGGIYKDKRVFDFHGRCWDPAIFVEDWRSDALVGAYLLVAIDPDKGEPVDLAGGSQIANWFLHLASAEPQLSAALRQLDSQLPGWRKLLRDRFDDLEDEIDRRVYAARLQHLEEIIQRLELGSEGLRDLAAAEAFSELWGRAVAERHRELQEEALQLWEPERARLQSEQETLTGDVARLRTERKRLVNEHEERVRVIRELGQHLTENRERLLRDLTVVQALSASSGESLTLSSSQAAPDLANLLAMRALPVTMDTGSEQSSAEFASSCLAEALASLSLPREDSKLLHAGMLAEVLSRGV